MWEININDQIFTFICSIVLGILVCVFYDVIRAFRTVFNPRDIIVFIWDIIFWLINAFTVFLFLLARTNGEVRGYVLLASLFGFILFRVTLSKFLVKILSFCIERIKFAIDKITDGFYGLSAIIYRFLSQFTKKTLFFVKKVFKKRKNS